METSSDWLNGSVEGWFAYQEILMCQIELILELVEPDFGNSLDVPLEVSWNLSHEELRGPENDDLELLSDVKAKGCKSAHYLQLSDEFHGLPHPALYVWATLEQSIISTRPPHIHI